MMYKEVKEELKGYWEEGYQFFESSWYGDYQMDSWEEVEEFFEELEEDEYLHFGLRVYPEVKELEMWHDSDE